jgi:serine/threonine protein kinase
MFPKYNGEKSDIFACGATLFMMYMQSPPFRKAISTDPYYKRLSSAVKQNYWKIFKNISSSPEFRELSEKTLQKYPNQRYSIDQIKGSQFFESDSETISTE